MRINFLSFWVLVWLTRKKKCFGFRRKTFVSFELSCGSTKNVVPGSLAIAGRTFKSIFGFVSCIYRFAQEITRNKITNFVQNSLSIILFVKCDNITRSALNSHRSGSKRNDLHISSFCMQLAVRTTSLTKIQYTSRNAINFEIKKNSLFKSLLKYRLYC